jgi:hypothetical protein
MLDADPRNADVIFPYMNGEDLNSDPEQRPSRYVINFWDWPVERAKHYTLPFERVQERVKPERDLLGGNATAEGRKKKWWLYGRDGKALYHAIGRGDAFERHPAERLSQSSQPMERVIGITRVSKFLNAALLPNDCIFTLDLFIFALNGFDDLALLQSSIHDVWTRKQASTQETRLRYTATDCFETLPLPEGRKVIAALGENYSHLRSVILRERGVGLTQLYNRFHISTEPDDKIKQLRDLHAAIDVAVANIYGWSDLDLDHGFHSVPYLPENDRVRFTISEKARLEVLRRLGELNRLRFEAEQESIVQTKKPRSSKSRTKSATPTEQGELDLGSQPRKRRSKE